jgi:hypothetical protein
MHGGEALMKVGKLVLSLAVLFGLCLPVAAQTERLRLEVPFSFAVAGKTMPAGRYEVKRVWNANNITWTIQGEESGIQVTTTSVQSPTVSHQPSLVFLESEGTYSLAEIWESEHSGQEVPRPRTPTATNSKYFEISIAR